MLFWMVFCYAESFIFFNKFLCDLSPSLLESIDVVVGRLLSSVLYDEKIMLDSYSFISLICSFLFIHHIAESSFVFLWIKRHASRHSTKESFQLFEIMFLWVETFLFARLSFHLSEEISLIKIKAEEKSGSCSRQNKGYKIIKS